MRGVTMGSGHRSVKLSGLRVSRVGRDVFPAGRSHTMSDLTTPNARDLWAVLSRVSWEAITAGAMVALATYVVLTLLGLAVGLEVAVRGSEVSLRAPAAIYTLVTL